MAALGGLAAGLGSSFLLPLILKWLARSKMMQKIPGGVASGMEKVGGHHLTGLGGFFGGEMAYQALTQPGEVAQVRTADPNQISYEQILQDLQPQGPTGMGGPEDLQRIMEDQRIQGLL